MPLLSRRPKLIPASDLAHDAIKAINQAAHRVVVVVTTLRDDDERSHELIEALCRAGDRGVLVSVCVDTVTYLEPKEFLLRSPKRQPARAYQAMKLERHLKKHGSNFRWLGRTGNISVAGRTHSKWIIADDTVYSFGGVNLDSASFDNNDYLLQFVDRNLADSLFKEHMRLVGADRGAHALRNHTFEVNDKSTVLIDGGLTGNSIIYRRACALAREAETIVLLSQYCPTGKLSRILKRKNATLYFNHWKQAAWVNKAMIRFGMLFARHQTGYTRSAYLHAKCMICTMPSGKKVAITGSHNFMFGSGMMGTREIALETTDPHLIKQLERFIVDRVV